MQMPASHRDIYQAVEDGTLGGWFDFLVPDFMSTGSGTPAVPPYPAATGATPDSGPGWFSGLVNALPNVLTAGLNAYSTTQLMNNPMSAAAVIRAGSTPAGVTPANPYGIPSGLALPPGVTPGQYGYPSSYYTPQPGFFSSPMALPIVIGAGGLLLIMLMQKRGRA